MAQRRAGGRAGYVYVLATVHHTSSGTPIVKIGMTTRSPEQRLAELSRGGPIGMTLEGFVTASDSRALEMAAHTKFQHVRFKAGGGSEYFTAEPSEVLAWLRSAAPRLDLDSAQRQAWSEYCGSEPYKHHARLSLVPIYSAGIGFWIGLIWHPNVWIMVLATPVGLGFGLVITGVFFRPRLKRLNQERAGIRSHLEKKYNLPAGEVRWKA